MMITVLQRCLIWGLLTVSLLGFTGCDVLDMVKAPVRSVKSLLFGGGKSGDVDGAGYVVAPPDIPPTQFVPTPLPAISADERFTPRPEENLLSLARQQAATIGILPSAAVDSLFASTDWKTQPMTRRVMAQWLARWASTRKPLPVLPSADLSPFADMSMDDEAMPALRAAQAADWLPFDGKAETAMYAHPETTLTHSDLLGATSATHQWLQGAGKPIGQTPAMKAQAALAEALQSGLLEAIYDLPADDWQNLPPETRQQWLDAPATHYETILTLTFWLTGAQ